MAARNGEHRKTSARSQPALWERIVALAGLALVVVLLTYLGYQAIANHEKPPYIVVSVTEVSRNASGFLVQFVAENLGDGTAAGVLVTGELRRNGRVVESAQATLDYIPAKSRRGGGLFFTRDPREHELRLAPSGYTTP